MTKQVPLRRYAFLGMVYGVGAVAVNLVLGIVFGLYFALDFPGTVLLSLAAASSVFAEYGGRGETPRLRDIIAAVLAVVIPFLVPQVPVIWLGLGHFRSLYADLALAGVIIFAAWMYIASENWEARWRRVITRGTRAPEEEIRYPIWFFVLGILSGGFFLALLIVSNTIGKNETTTWWTSALFGGMALAGAAVVVAYLFERHYISSEGIWYRPPFGLGPQRFMAWSEVSAVDYSPRAQWFVLTSYSGAKARIPLFATNTDRFARILMAHVSRGVISDRAMRMLRMLTGEEDDES